MKPTSSHASLPVTRRNRRWLTALLSLLFPASPATWAAELPGVAITSADLQKIAVRRQMVLDAAKSNPLDLQSNSKVTMYEILASTAKVGCGEAKWREYVVNLPKVDLTPGAAIEGLPVFSLPPLARYLHQFGHCLTAADKAAIATGLTRVKRGLFYHGTLNLAIIQMTSWYLFAQYFPKAIWTDVDGARYTSAELMAKLKRLLARRTANFYTHGHYEMLSPTYAMSNIFPLNNLYDFAVDPDVKKNAAAELILDVGVLRAHSFNGVIVSPLTRYITDQINAPQRPANYKIASSQQVLWYYYGVPTLSAYDLRAFEPYYIAMLALSSWSPPLAKKSTVSVAGDAYVVKVAVPRSNVIDSPTTTEITGNSLFTTQFALGTANSSFNPSGYGAGKQLFSIVYATERAHNEITCSHAYWSANQGTDAWVDRWSPFLQTYRYDDSSMIMLLSIPQTDPWQYPDNFHFSSRSVRASDLDRRVQCRIPRSAEKIETSSDGMFVKNGDVYVAIRPLNATPSFATGSPPEATANYSVIKIDAAAGAFFVRVERDTQGRGLEAFKKRVRERTPVYKAASNTVELIEMNGTKTTVSFKLSNHSDGWVASYPQIQPAPSESVASDQAVFDSPLLELRDGQLLIPAGGQRFVFRSMAVGRQPNPPSNPGAT